MFRSSPTRRGLAAFVTAVALALTLQAPARAEEAPDGMFMVQSEHPITSMGERLAEAAKRHGYGLAGTHDLRAMMDKKGVALGRDVIVFEVCNPAHAKVVLGENVAVASMLPCRIAAWTEGSKTVLSMVDPTKLLGMFPASETMRETAALVEKDLQTIMREAAAK
jgi:uncharacterized protein (DUF302 family)